MQNNINHSSLLQGYIQAQKQFDAKTYNAQNPFYSNNSFNTNSITSSVDNSFAPKYQEIDRDKFEIKQGKKEVQTDPKKQKNAKTALLTTIGITAAAVGILTFRHKNQIGDFIKKTYDGIKNSKLSENMGEIAHNASDAGRKIQTGSDNLINGKDTIARKILSHIPGYKKFDAFTSNQYRKIAKNVTQGSWDRTSTAVSEADGAIKKLLEETGGDKTLIDLLQRRIETVKNLAKNSETRFRELDDSFKEIADVGFERIKQNSKTGFFKNLKSYLDSNIGEETIQSARQKLDGMLSQYKFGGLSESETIKLNNGLKELFKSHPELKTKFDKAQKLFQKTYAKENVSLFSKLRDINFGCAPTDMLTIAAATLGLGVYTAQADTKEEKIGVTLTTGIPLLATLATTTAATCKMISGGKASVLGLVVGWMANFVGKKANEQYQKRTDTNYEQTIVTLDDYKNKFKEDIIKINPMG